MGLGHPQFTPDGKAALYTSDLTAYSNMYLVEVGEFEGLQELSLGSIYAMIAV